MGWGVLIIRRLIALASAVCCALAAIGSGAGAGDDKSDFRRNPVPIAQRATETDWRVERMRRSVQARQQAIEARIRWEQAEQLAREAAERTQREAEAIAAKARAAEEAAVAQAARDARAAEEVRIAGEALAQETARVIQRAEVAVRAARQEAQKALRLQDALDKKPIDEAKAFVKPVDPQPPASAPSPAREASGPPPVSREIDDEVKAFIRQQKQKASDFVARTLERQFPDLSALDTESLLPPFETSSTSTAASAAPVPKTDEPTPLAALTPPNAALPGALPLPAPQSRTEIIKAVQREMKRLACYRGAVSGRLDADTAIALDVAARSWKGPPRAWQPLNAEIVQIFKDRTEPLCDGRIACGAGQAKQDKTCIAALPAKVQEPDDDEEDKKPVKPKKPRRAPIKREAQATRISHDKPRAAPSAPVQSAPPAASRPARNPSRRLDITM